MAFLPYTSKHKQIYKVLLLTYCVTLCLYSFLCHDVDIVLFFISRTFFVLFSSCAPPSTRAHFHQSLFFLIIDFSRKYFLMFFFIQLENLCPQLDSQPFTCHLLLPICSVWILHNLVYNITDLGSVQLILIIRSVVSQFLLYGCFGLYE